MKQHPKVLRRKGYTVLQLLLTIAVVCMLTANLVPRPMPPLAQPEEFQTPAPATFPLDRTHGADPLPGLRIKEITVGRGQVAQRGQSVTILHQAYFDGGQHFPRANRHLSPFQFVIGGGQVAENWEAGVMGMRVGGKRRLIVPARAIYRGGKLPPGMSPRAAVVHEIQLLRVEPPFSAHRAIPHSS
jgi:peptidylprolyl isomerase